MKLIFIITKLKNNENEHIINSINTEDRKSDIIENLKYFTNYSLYEHVKALWIQNS